MPRLYNAAGTITRSRFVRLSSSGNNSVVQCGLGEQPIGVSQYGSREAPLPSVTDNPSLAAKSGDALEVHVVNETHETPALEIGLGGCLAGDTLIADADGKGIVGTGAIGAIALEAAAAGELAPVFLMHGAQSGLPTVVQEFSVATGLDPNAKVLFPAALNKKGLVVVAGFGLITQVMAGSSEDQGVVTVRDSDGNALFTLTPSDAAADIVNDIVTGHFASTLSTGAAAKVLPAGKGIVGIVTQPTAGGSPAGKMKVVLQLAPLG